MWHGAAREAARSPASPTSPCCPRSSTSAGTPCRRRSAGAASTSTCATRPSRRTGRCRGERRVPRRALVASRCAAGRRAPRRPRAAHRRPPVGSVVAEVETGRPPRPPAGSRGPVRGAGSPRAAPRSPHRARARSGAPARAAARSRRTQPGMPRSLSDKRIEPSDGVQDPQRERWLPTHRTLAGTRTSAEVLAATARGRAARGRRRCGGDAARRQRRAPPSRAPTPPPRPRSSARARARRAGPPDGRPRRCGGDGRCGAPRR